MKIIVTGGAGFIGSHLTRHFVNKYPNYKILNIDALTYAGNLMSLQDIEKKDNYAFERIDIKNEDAVNKVFERFKPDVVLHCAAESHVDRSILNPNQFAETNILGTLNLLQSAVKNWSGSEKGKCFYQISTDEVYGALGEDGLFTESTAYDPRSPYSASKAAADHFVRAFYHTYDLPILISKLFK